MLSSTASRRNSQANQCSTPFNSHAIASFASSNNAGKLLPVIAHRKPPAKAIACAVPNVAVALKHNAYYRLLKFEVALSGNCFPFLYGSFIVQCSDYISCLYASKGLSLPAARLPAAHIIFLMMYASHEIFPL